MVKLKTTEEQFNGLHEAADKARKSSEFVKVNRQALINLLMDHGEVLSKVAHTTEA